MIRIRSAATTDLDALVALLKVLFSIEADFAVDPQLQRQGLQQMLAQERGCILVAEDQGRVVGMCTGQVVISTAEGGPALLVEDVVVHDDWRGKGVGRRLMAGLEQWAARQGIQRLQLLADLENKPAFDFYDRLGWRTTQLVCLRRYI